MMREQQRVTLWRSWMVALLFLGSLLSAFAQNGVEDFYRGRQVNLIVGYGPGGGYDMVARLLARHLGRYVPGNPTIVAQNMPGAGSMRAVNYLYSIAPKDGATFGLFGSDMPLIGLIGNNPNVQFDPRKFTWLGSSSSFAGDAYVLMVRPNAPARSIAEARRPGGPPLVLAGTGEGARDGDVPKILRDALALNIKQVLGYPDTPSIFLAVERGEVDGRTFDFSAVKSSKPQWLEPASGFRILVQFARVTRHPELGDVPTARELALGDAARALIELSEAPLLGMARPFAAPPGVPEDRARALRSAFLAVHRDPAFLAEAEKLGVDISPVGAEEVLLGIERMAHGSPDAFNYMTRLLATHKGPQSSAPKVSAAPASDYPHRAVKIIVSAPPGGGLDIAARVIADRLAGMWGQPFVVENRPGAGGNLGAEAVAQAEPDGYTLLAAQPAPLTTNVRLYKKLNFDPAAFEPLAIMTSIPNTLVVRSDFPAGSVAELIAYAKANPGKVNFGSQGVGTTPHLTGELFARVTGTILIHVPYRGTAQAVNDLIAGHLDMLFFQLDSVREQYQAKKAKMLAVTTGERVSAVPEVPTMGEAGVGDFRSDTWNALAAPPRTPMPIVAKLNQAINEVLKNRETAEQLRSMNMTPVGGTPAEIRKFIKEETERWGDVIRTAKIKLQQ